VAVAAKDVCDRVARRLQLLVFDVDPLRLYSLLSFAFEREKEGTTTQKGIHINI
jgi:hypothetical protein